MVLETAGKGGEAPVFRPGRVPQHPAEPLPLVLGTHSNRAPAIAAGATVDPVWRGGRLLRAVTARGEGGVVDEDVKQRRADQARDRLKLREINELALAGASAVPYRHEHGQRAGIAAGHVGVGIAPA